MDSVKKAIAKYFRIFEFVSVLRHDAKRVWILWIFKIAGLIAAVLLPLLTKWLIDIAIGQKNWVAFTQNAIISLTIVFSSFAAAVGSSWYSTRIAETFGFRLRLALQKRLERMEVSQLRRWNLGDQICLANSDVQNVSHVLVEVLPGSTILILEFLLFAIIAFGLHARLTLLFSLSFPVVIAQEFFHARATRPLQHKLQQFSAEVSELIGEFITGILTFKSFAIERRHTRKYSHVLSQKIRQSLHKWKIDSWYQGLQWVVQTGWGWAVLFYGFALVMRGDLSLGTLLALKMYFTALGRPLDEATSISQSIVVGSVSAERLLDVLQAPIESAENPQSLSPLLASGNKREASGLVLDNISFGYHAQRRVFRHVTTSFSPGKLIGITGPSGAGKTTLLSLIARLYRPWAGSIRVGDTDLARLRREEVASLVSVVLQETFLFQGTIYDNISCARADVTEADVTAAARMAGAHDFILDLPAGYQTDVRATGLSIGQKQRIGIARALAKKSAVLALDEPTSALDVGFRKTIMDSLRRVSRDRLVILISHDPDTLAHCDEVFMVSGGQVEHLDAELQASFPQFIEYLALKSVYETSFQRADSVKEVLECAAN